MRAKSEEYYGRYPQDRDRMERLSELAGRGELIIPCGDIVGPERLRSLGAMLGRAGGADAIHHLLERDPSSWGFRYDLGQSLAFGGRFPLYAVIHESCWADAGTTDWAAQRVRPAVFDDDPTLLTGEHVRHEVFLEDTALRPWLEVADLLAAHEWPALYDPTRLKTTTTPGAAAVYARDVFVPMVTSLETAALIPGLRTWITSEHEHDGSRASGGKVFNRLRDLATGMIAR
jgi:prolyl aminopeptidase